MAVDDVTVLNKPAASKGPSRSVMASAWLSRMLTGLGAMTVLGTIAIIIPYFLSGFAAAAASLLIAFLLFGAAIMIWRELVRARFDNRRADRRRRFVAGDFR